MLVALTNQKGGVGKTTSALNIAVAAARHGARVLAVDLDPQCALTRRAGISVAGLPATLVDALVGDATPDEVLVRGHHGVDWLPGHPSLADVEHTLARRDLGADFLAATLDDVGAESYDLAILDCPPNLGQLSLNALAPAELVLVAVSATDEGAAQGVMAVRHSLERLEHTPRVELVLTKTSVLRTQRRVTERTIADALTALGLPEPLARIPSRTIVEHADVERIPLVLHAPDSPPAIAYDRLARTLLDSVLVA